MGDATGSLRQSIRECMAFFEVLRRVGVPADSIFFLDRVTVRGAAGEAPGVVIGKRITPGEVPLYGPPAGHDQGVDIYLTLSSMPPEAAYTPAAAVSLWHSEWQAVTIDTWARDVWGLITHDDRERIARLVLDTAGSIPPLQAMLDRPGAALTLDQIHPKAQA